MRCVMDTSDPNIVFNTYGICNLCTECLINYQKTANIIPTDETQFEEFAKMLKQKHQTSKYNCIIGLSGGIDSCYTTYLAKKYGLSPLLIHIDNGWNTEDAINNYQKIAKAFGFDLNIIKLDQIEYREVQIAFLKSGILDFELAFDVSIPALLHQTAKKHGVKAILSGGNYASEGILPLDWGYHPYKDNRLYKHIISKYCSLNPKKIPTFSIYKEFYYKMILGIKTYYPLNLIHYNKDEAKSTLEAEMNLVFPSNKHHESRFTRFWQTYVVPTKFGIDFRRSTLSSQICSGQKTRKDALEILSKELQFEFNVDEEKAYICEKMDFSLSAFEEFLASHPTKYYNFPNSYKTIRFVHNAYKLLFKK